MSSDKFDFFGLTILATLAIFIAMSGYSVGKKKGQESYELGFQKGVASVECVDEESVNLDELEQVIDIFFDKFKELRNE